MPTALSQVKASNSKWFSPQNKKFFGDKEYMIRYGKKSGDMYLVRSTWAWTDMFGGKRRLHYRINLIDQSTLEIKNLISGAFDSMWDVKEWLSEH